MAQKLKNNKTSKSVDGPELNKLVEENKRLLAENKRLSGLVGKEQNSVKNVFGVSFLRSLAVVFFVTLSVALLISGNILLWAGNTVVKTDKFVQTVGPVIKDSVVQDAVANYASEKLFEKVDTEALVENALPPRADFLAPTISVQLEEKADDAIRQVVASEKFQTIWDRVQEQAFEKFAESAKTNGTDGSIDISEFYVNISEELKTTKLSFLADKPLPEKVGKIKILEGRWLKTYATVANNIETFRIVSVGLLLVSMSLAVWLSKNRRKVVILLGIFLAVGMLISNLSVRIAGEIVANNVKPQNQEAVRHIYEIVTRPLIIQTLSLLVLALLVAIIAWISGNSKGARKTKSFIGELFSGKVHSAIFRGKENKFTMWVARHKKLLEWLAVAVIAVTLLLVRVTFASLIGSFIVLVVLVILIEIFSAKSE